MLETKWENIQASSAENIFWLSPYELADISKTLLAYIQGVITFSCCYNSKCLFSSERKPSQSFLNAFKYPLHLGMVHSVVMKREGGLEDTSINYKATLTNF